MALCSLFSLVGCCISSDNDVSFPRRQYRYCTYEEWIGTLSPLYPCTSVSAGINSGHSVEATYWFSLCRVCTRPSSRQPLEKIFLTHSTNAQTCIVVKKVHAIIIIQHTCRECNFPCNECHNPNCSCKRTSMRKIKQSVETESRKVKEAPPTLCEVNVAWPRLW